jgi:hypothetical protein
MARGGALQWVVVRNQAAQMVFMKIVGRGAKFESLPNGASGFAPLVSVA